MIYEEDFRTLNDTYKDKRLNGEMVRLIGKITGTDVLDEFEEDEEVEGSKMCRALENLKESGRAEGLYEGELKKARETAVSLDKMGIPVEKIAEAVNVRLETVKEWINETVHPE